MLDNKEMDETTGFQTGLKSPIPQVDGFEEKNDEKVTFTFLSEYAEEDILYSFTELFPGKNVATLVSRVLVNPRTADHLCTVVLQLVDPQKFSWPPMGPVNTEVFREIRRIQQ